MQWPAIADYPPGARMPRRVLDDFEFVWMLDGWARVTLDAGELPLAPGQLLLLPGHAPGGGVGDGHRVGLVGCST